MAATQVLVARSCSNGDTVGVCGQILPTFQPNVVNMLKRLWDGGRLFRVSWCPNYVVHNHCPEAYEVCNWFAL